MFDPKRILWTVVLAGVVALGAQAQTTWYVDASAAPPGVGTQLRPYSNIQYAIDQPTTKDGDSLLVAPGDYVGDIIVNKNLSVRGALGPAQTRLIGEGPWPTVYLGPSGGYTYILEGLTILAPARAIWSESQSAVTVRRCILVSLQQGGLGIFIAASLGLTRIEHCTLIGFTTGIQSDVTACSPIQVDSCIFADIPFDLGDGGTWCDGSSKVASYCAFDALYSVDSWLVTHPTVSPDLGLWSPESLDVHLAPLSACIDASNPSSPPDPDGSRADIGALAYDPLYADTPTTYCTGKVHSGGCAPRMTWSGTPTLSGADDFVLRANLALDGMAGKFIWSFAPQATPFAGGNLCIAPPIVRGPMLNSGGIGTATNCSGVFSWPVSHAAMQSNQWLPGQIVYAQAWGRDVNSAFPEKSQLSDAIVFQVLP
jgi:hypothetical protein